MDLDWLLMILRLVLAVARRLSIQGQAPMALSSTMQPVSPTS
jgi:hypothetical protein